MYKMEFTHHKSFGNDWYYPVDKEVLFILQLFGKKCFTKEHLIKMRKNGWEIKIQQKQLDFDELIDSAS